MPPREFAGRLRRLEDDATLVPGRFNVALKKSRTIVTVALMAGH
jgi:hypothetical protein